MKGWRGVVAVAALGVSLMGSRPAQAGFLEDAGWGSLTVLSNVIYMPAKVVYSLLGGVTGGFAYALTGGDMQTAETLWVTTMGGTYVVTPRMLQGEDPIAFSGSPAGDTTANGDTGSGEIKEQQLGDS